SQHEILFNQGRPTPALPHNRHNNPRQLMGSGLDMYHLLDFWCFLHRTTKLLAKRLQSCRFPETPATKLWNALDRLNAETSRSLLSARSTARLRPSCWGEPSTAQHSVERDRPVRRRGAGQDPDAREPPPPGIAIPHCAAILSAGSRSASRAGRSRNDLAP